MASQGITGSQVYNRLAFAASATASDSTTVKANLINRAIRASWPHIKLHERQQGGTFATNTYEYTLSVSPAPHPDWGVYGVYVRDSTDTSNAKILTRDVAQWYDHSAAAWVIEIAPAVVTTYVGDTFDVAYQYPHPDISTLSDMIYLPTDYLINYIEYLLARRKLSENPTDNRNWRDIMLIAKEDYENALKSHHTPQINPLRRRKDKMRT